MAAVEVLHPQDPLQNRLNYRDTNFVNSAMKSKRNSSSNPNPKPNRGFGKSDRRKRSPQKNSGNNNANRSGGVNFSSYQPEAKGNLMMGQVKILKRGEALSDTAAWGEELKKIGEKGEAKGCIEGLENDLVLSTTGRLGPEPDMMPKEFNIANFYAGSACISSPPPSSLPVPAFFKKKNILVENNDYATCDLRRLLRLNLS